MSDLSAQDQQKQIHYRDARFTDKYDDIWQNVGKCVFCDLKEKYVFFEENGVVLTISLFAYIDGHCMIIPRRHVRSAKDLTQLEWEAVRKLMYVAKRLIKDIHHVKGLQIVQKEGENSTSTVEHLHYHCVPFDSPDLNKWNYRELKNTPLENVEIYKKARKKIITSANKYEEKYLRPLALPIICDALIFNEDGEILLEERRDDLQLVGNYFTPPGGMVSNLQASLEDELVREIHEETGLKIKSGTVKLISSQISTMHKIRQSKQLRAKYKFSEKFLWNTYLIENVSKKSKLVAGDDAKNVFWLPVKQALKNDKVSPEIRQLISKALKS